MKKQKFTICIVAIIGLLAISMILPTMISKAEGNEHENTMVSPLFKIRTEKANRKEAVIQFLTNYIKGKMSEDRLLFPLISIFKSSKLTTIAPTSYYCTCITMCSPKCRYAQGTSSLSTIISSPCCIPTVNTPPKCTSATQSVSSPSTIAPTLCCWTVYGPKCPYKT